MLGQFFDQFVTAAFWVSVLQIIAIDLVLAADNAIAIALACRSLPPHQRKLGIRWGVGIAIVLRVVVTIIIAKILQWPFIHLVGGILLIFIGIKVLRKQESHADTPAASSVKSAIYIIVMADVIMSLDNMLAVASAARGNTFLLIFGLAISIPMMLWLSQALLKLMARFPLIEYFGSALLGWLGGGLIAREHALIHLWGEVSKSGQFLCALLGALIVMAWGWQERFRVLRIKNPEKFD